MNKENNFFPEIGKVVEKAHNVSDSSELTNDVEDEQPVQEVESLCMNCGENVRPHLSYLTLR